MPEIVLEAMPAPHSDVTLNCGACKWFDLGYKGKTCQVTRGVLRDTGACIEYVKSPDIYFVNLARTDKIIVEINRASSSFVPDSTLSTELGLLRPMSEEVKEEYNTQAPSKYENTSDLLQLHETMKLVHSFKERVLAVRLEIMPSKKALEELYEKAEEYIYQYHYDEIMNYKNIGERARIIHNIYSPLWESLTKFNNIIEVADLVMQNLNDAHFCMKELSSLAVLIYNNKKSMNMVDKF